MKRFVFPLVFLVSLSGFSQQIEEEFIATIIEDKEAFLSTKTGEFVYRAHAKTNVAGLYTSENGSVVYEDRKEHVVKKGETLSAVAKKHGVSVAELKAQNKIKSKYLSIGQKLKIAIKEVVPSSKPVLSKAEGKIIARLAPGQTPGGMTPPDLPPDAMPGSTINLVVENDAKKPVSKPREKPRAQEGVEVGDIAEDGTMTHIVKSGETLFSIGRKYKMAIADLKKDNNLALNTISTGQKLKVKVYNPAVFNQNQETKVENTKPILQKKKVVKEVIEAAEDDAVIEKEAVVEKKPEAPEIKETVKEDLKEPIKEEKKKTKEAIKKEVKTLSKSEVEKEKKVEDLIKKYAKKEVATKEKPDAVAEAKKEDKEEYSVYVVRKGDTLWSIAKRHHISLKDLKEINKLTTNVLSVGQKLKLK